MPPVHGGNCSPFRRRACSPGVVGFAALVLGLTVGGQTAAGAALAPTNPGSTPAATPTALTAASSADWHDPGSGNRPWTASEWQSHNTCRGVFHGPQSGSLIKTTSAGPTGGAVSPGQKITVTLTWKPSDFSGNRPFLTEDCVKVGSHLVAALSQVHILGPTTGTDTFSYVVPAGGTGGQPICDRAVASGLFDPRTGWGDGGDGNSGNSGNDGGGGSWSEESHTDKSWTGGSGQGDDSHKDGDDPEKSAVLCYSILAVATPEVPSALLLPAAGFLVGGAVLLVVRRRQNGADV